MNSHIPAQSEMSVLLLIPSTVFATSHHCCHPPKSSQSRARPVVSASPFGDSPESPVPGGRLLGLWSKVDRALMTFGCVPVVSMVTSENPCTNQSNQSKGHDVVGLALHQLEMLSWDTTNRFDVVGGFKFQLYLISTPKFWEEFHPPPIWVYPKLGYPKIWRR